MSYGIEQPLPAWRRIDIPSVAGLAMASVGAAAVVIEVNSRGWWGFATAWFDLSTIAVWLGLAGWLSRWAFERAHGWWHIPAFLGLAVSVVTMVVPVVLFAWSLLTEHPDILTADSKEKQNSSRRRRPRQRR